MALVFFDLDGTLLNAKSQVNPPVYAAVRALKSKGHLPIICSGRALSQIPDVMTMTGIDTLILMNGQVILHEGQEIYSCDFGRERIDRMLEIIEPMGLAFSYINNIESAHSAYSADLLRSCERFNLPVPRVDPTFHHSNPVNMMLISCSDPAMDARLRALFPALNFFRTSPNTLDITIKPNSKAMGMVRLGKALGLEGERRYAFGDGQNDISMLAEADVAIAMGNAEAEVKQAADYVTGSHLDDGVVQGLRHFGLID